MGTERETLQLNYRSNRGQGQDDNRTYRCRDIYTIYKCEVINSNGIITDA